MKNLLASIIFLFSAMIVFNTKSMNLGYSNEGIINGWGLAQALAGEAVGTNSIAESITGFDLGANEFLDTEERVIRGFLGGVQAVSTVAGATGTVNHLLKNATNATKKAPLGPGCFLAGTLVSVYRPENADCRQLVPIEDVQPGEQVWACNPRTGQWEPKTVLQALRRQYSGDIIKFAHQDDVIEATSNHPIWVVEGENLENRPKCRCLNDFDNELRNNGRWVEAKDLQVGDELLSRTGEAVHILSVESHIEETMVFNFDIDDFHTYAVGVREVLVHNNSKHEPMKRRQADWDEGDFNPPKKMTGVDKADLGKARAEFDSHGAFRRWFDTDYKPKHKAPNGITSNPDSSPGMLLEAYREWLSRGMPNP